LSRNLIWNIYFTKVYSLLWFGILYLGRGKGGKLIARIVRTQKQVIRPTVAVSTRTSCRQLFKELNILTLVSLYIMEVIYYIYRLLWSRGSVLAFSTQVCGFKPSWSRQNFRAKKSSAPFFRREVKPSVPCHRFAACKISLNLFGSRNLGKITTGHISCPQFHLSLLGCLASLQTEAPGG